MDTSEVLFLARAQFGLNIGFHILFPTLTIALAWILLYFRVRYARSGDPAWLATYKLWTKVFALTFAMGVVTGITMSFQFGTNWPGFMHKVGNIAGPLLAYEVLTAFFLEATFLGIMLFGMNRVPGWVHIFASSMVAIGTTAVGVLDPRAQFLDADARGTRGAGRAGDRRRLVAGALQPLVPVPLHPHAARLGAHRVLRRRGPVGVAAAARARRCLGADDAAHGPGARRGARAACRPSSATSTDSIRSSTSRRRSRRSRRSGRPRRACRSSCSRYPTTSGAGTTTRSRSPRARACCSSTTPTRS